MLRHGDLLLIPVPEPATAVSGGDFHRDLVLLEGQATGHAHRLVGLAEPVRDRDRALVHVAEPSKLRHEEHFALPVPAGWYELVRQRVYTPSALVPVRD